jgi:probable HAF family extracellular repeat protein
LILELRYNRPLKDRIPDGIQEKTSMRMPRIVAFVFCVVLPLIPFAAKAQTFKFQSVGFVTPNAINSSGTIAGSFCCGYVSGFDGAQALSHGFSLKLNGSNSQVFTVAEPMGIISSFASGIAPNGDVVGGFCPALDGCASGNAVHGYLFSAVSNSAVQIDVPGAIATLVGGINKSEQMVGMSCNTTTCGLSYAGESHGFQLDHPGGSFTTLDFPGALGTAAAAINDAGDIVGNYLSCKGTPCTFAQGHGFLFTGGTYTRLDPPGSLATTVSAINNSGEIVGTYLDGNNKTHGFLFKTGVFTNVDFPGASVTAVTGVNDQGQIVGWARIGSGVENFIGTPQ